MNKICVFAGTSEGRRLIESLCGRGLAIIACVATEYGEILLGEHQDVSILTGRMDAEQMRMMLAHENVDLVIDATHPYAEIVSDNIFSACRAANVQYLRLLRDSESETGDGIFVENACACAQYLKSTEGTILLTTGSKDLAAYKAIKDRLYVRILPMEASLRISMDVGIASERIIAMQGPFDEEMNLALLHRTNAKYLVTKDTGESGGYGAKIAAAKKAGVQCVIIGRPRERSGLGLDEVLELIEKRFALQGQNKRVALVGVGMCNADTRTLGMERAINQAQCLIGAKRMLEAVDTSGKSVHTAVLAEDIALYIRNSSEQRFAVLLSGDVGFYSGAKKLAEELSDMQLEIICGVGSMQYFCAKLRRPWENVRAVSLHGRDCDFVREVRENAAVFALVGGENGVQNALMCLQKAGMGELKAHIGQKLGYPDEKIIHGTVEELLNERFDSLSVILIENEYSDRFVVTHGLPDDAFIRDETPMTKAEIRSVSISKLALTQSAVVYDIGSGSGSVSVECALMAKHGRVYAIERKEKALALTRKNVDKFALRNVEIISGQAPEALENLPAPSHAFIGGSAGNMREIIDCLLKKNPNVRIVATTVTLETLAQLSQIAREFDFCDIAEVSVAKSGKAGGYHLMTAQNPVFVFTLQNGATA